MKYIVRHCFFSPPNSKLQYFITFFFKFSILSYFFNKVVHETSTFLKVVQCVCEKNDDPFQHVWSELFQNENWRIGEKNKKSRFFFRNIKGWKVQKSDQTSDIITIYEHDTQICTSQNKMLHCLNPKHLKNIFFFNIFFWIVSCIINNVVLVVVVSHQSTSTHSCVKAFFFMLWWWTLLQKSL